jgi:hypothetical protein
MNARTLIAPAVAFILIAGLGLAIAQNDEIELVHIRGPIYMIGGAGANITISAGPDGVLLVDTGLAQNSDRVITAIRQLQRQITMAEPPLKYGSENRSELQAIRATPPPPKPIRYILIHISIWTISAGTMPSGKRAGRLRAATSEAIFPTLRKARPSSRMKICCGECPKPNLR